LSDHDQERKEPDEPTGRQLKNGTEAWTLLASLNRKEHFAVVEAHDPETDKLSESVQARTGFDATYSATFRIKSDHEIPSKVIDAVQTEHMPQFTLRNIGRAERHVDLDDPMPFRRKQGISHHDDGLFEEVRNARLPKPEFAQIWSVAFTHRLRRQFRRLLIEDPWELRYGSDVTANYGVRQTHVFVEGTHPDDLPQADWGPETLPPPRRWKGRSIDSDDNVQTFHDIAQAIVDGND